MEQQFLVYFEHDSILSSKINMMLVKAYSFESACVKIKNHKVPAYTKGSDKTKTWVTWTETFKSARNFINLTI